MAAGDNNIHDIVNKSVGRDATPYELETFGKASPQTIANLPQYYSSLNKDSSIVDYLKYTGQDSSTANRLALGQKYGITNIGTAEGNTALLNALKSGKTAPTAPQTPITGSITTPPTNTQTNPVSGVGGTVASAATPPATSPTDTSQVDPNTGLGLTIDTDPTVQGYKTAYNAVQKTVADIDTQISQLRALQNSDLQNKMDEIHKSGGVVSESSLEEAIKQGNALYQNRINDLLAQRTPYATQQAQAGKDYQDAQANYWKGITASQNQEKIGQTSQKMDIQQQQFTQKEQDVANKLEQSGYKLASTTDEFGNKVNYWTKNPSDTSGFDSNGKPVSVSTDPQGNTTVTPKDNPTNTDTSNPNGLSVAQYGLLANVKDFDPVKNTIDKDAYTYLLSFLSGSSTTSSSIAGGKTLQLKSDIQSRAATLYQEATGQKLPTANQVVINNKLLQTNQTLLNQLDVQTGTIQQNFGLNLENLTQNNINNSAPLVNNLKNWISANAGGDANVAQYLSQNQTIQNELASLLAVKNASGTTVADKLMSANLLPQGATVDQAKQIVGTLMQEAQNQSQTILNTNAKLYLKVDGLGLNPQNPVNNTIVLTDTDGNNYTFSPNTMTPQQLQDAFNKGYTLTSQQ